MLPWLPLREPGFDPQHSVVFITGMQECLKVSYMVTTEAFRAEQYYNFNFFSFSTKTKLTCKY